MKLSTQFWFASGLALSCLITTRPASAQQITPPVIFSGTPAAVSSALRQQPRGKGVNIVDPITLSRLRQFFNRVDLLVPPCSAYGASTFIITGRGGLPDNPNNLLSTDAVWVDLITLNPRVGNLSSPTVSANPTSPASAPIVEAQGWLISSNGEVVLTASRSTGTPHNPWLRPHNCRASQKSFQTIATANYLIKRMVPRTLDAGI